MMEKRSKIELCIVANLIMGQSPPSSTYNDEGIGLPFYQGKTDFGFIHPTPRKYCISPSKIAEKGDILISVRAPVGPVNIANDKCCIGRGIAAIRAYKFDQQYLYFNLISQENYIASLGTGSTFKAINKSRLESIEIPNIPLPEQRKIAYVLSTIQKAIEQQDKLIRTTTELKKALMQKLFTEGIGWLSGAEISLKQTEIGPVPESWEVRKLREIIITSKGGGTPSTKKKEYWNGDIFWTTSKWINEEKIFLFDGEKKITQLGLENSSTNLLPVDNLLVSTRVVIGKITINKVPIAYSQDLTGLWIDKSKYDLVFLAYQIKSEKINSYLQSLKRGATIQGITREDLLDTFLVIPSFKEQKEIGSTILIFDQKKEYHQRKKQILTDLFKTLLHELMTGQRRVHEIDFGFDFAQLKEQAHSGSEKEELLLMAAEPEVKYNKS